MSATVFEHLATLSDPVRVRMLRLLQLEELSVGELASVVQLPQSTVSRQIKALDAGGWIERRAEGTASYLRLAPLEGRNAELWRLVADQIDPHEHEHDLDRLAAVVAARQADPAAWFGRVARSWSRLRRALFGIDFGAAAIAAQLPPAWTVVDLGCGAGDLTASLAAAGCAVVGVDREAAMLEAAQARVGSLENVRFERRALEDLPFADASVDAAFCVLVLHHLSLPHEALAEAARVLKPGAALVVVDMVAHDRVEYRRTMGHRHLGFSRADVERLGEGCGLRLGLYRELPQASDAQGPAVFVARLERAR